MTVKMRVNILCVAAALILHNSTAFAVERLVPGQYPTIQAAIHDCNHGDTVVVEPNTYYENIDFGGKSITVTSTDPNEPAATVINAAGPGTVVTFPDMGNATCVLAGFTITDGNSSSIGGGGIRCMNGTITITNCIITGNFSAWGGGGAYHARDDVTFTGCVFSLNEALNSGGGIEASDGNLVLTGCRFSENVAGYSGGGIHGVEAELVLTDCTFSQNSAELEGGGIGSDYGSVALTDCTLTGNSAQWGGGMNKSHKSASATNCIFSGNVATEDGGGICTKQLEDYNLTLNNCTFSDNVADTNGGAVCNRVDGNVGLINCIAWGNSANEGPQIAMEDDGTLSISHCCLQGGELDVYTGAAVTLDWGDGNINTDPCFADVAGGDYHLRSTAGRWDADTSNWVTDDGSSLGIDAGDPCSDWTAELWPHDKRINMGAFGGTPQASMSHSEAGNISDIDCSDAVDGVDLRLITDKWLCPQALLSEDLNRDGLVNGGDFAIFAYNWAWEE